MQKIRCPFHEGDNTPSLTIYPDHYYCFGCGAYGALSALSGVTVEPSKPVKQEDLTASLERISGLPKKTIRGFSLPYDASGYYLVWPSRDFYIKRYWDEANGKYFAPIGHSRPVYIPQEGRYILWIVEGEFNALSLAGLVQGTVVSAGAATAFKKVLTMAKNYRNIVVIADKDKAGIKMAIDVKSALLKQTPYIHLFLMEKDVNDLLVTYGPDYLKTYLAMPSWMQNN